jgi:tRNA U38,U39,U40 pseudouridine synthase TruA
MPGSMCPFACWLTWLQVNKKFDARFMCHERTYEYYLPVKLLGWCVAGVCELWWRKGRGMGVG